MGRRKELINEIGEITGTENERIRKDELSLPQTEKIYETITGDDYSFENSKKWHLQKICEELGDHKTDNPRRISAKTLEKLRDHLKQSI